MRILCIGDSLGLPRQGVRYEDTWFYKLQKGFPGFEFIDMFERGLLITKANENFESLYTFYPSEVAIIQTGICDCAPRYINDEKLIWRIVIKIFTRLGIAGLFWKIVKFRSRNPSCTLTPLIEFENKYTNMLEKMYWGGKIWYCN